MARLKGPLGIAALIVLCSIGTAVAAKKITGKDIANHSITGRDIKRKSIPLSALRTVPASTKGEQGDKGEKGETGLTGEPGERGASALTEVFPLEGPIGAEIAASADWEFLGSETVVFFDGDRGQITVTAVIGSSAGIDDQAKFALAVCADLGEGPEPILPSGDGISPTLPAGERVAVPVSTFFGAQTETPGGSFVADVGPCVLNDTGVNLDENDRWQGTFLVAAL